VTITAPEPIGESLEVP